jgi:hypothetical protein
MIPNPCIEVQTSPITRPSVPAWFAEVVIMAQHLTTKGLLNAFAHQVPLVRGRFGRYELLDYLALLLGYAISGERTLAEFFERLAPFAEAFMALFGRSMLPHRSSLSRFLAAVDRPCLEALRALFQQEAFTDGWTVEQIGGLWDRQGQRCMVFDVDATRQAARQRALPCTPAWPPARRRFDAVCAPGYKGRKRGEVVRTRTTVLQMHTRQWIGTYGGRGNGDYRGELASALQAIIAYLAHFELPPDVALVRLDGQYGDAVVIAQIIQAGVSLVTRGRGYQLLAHPQIQRVLAHPPTTSVTSTNTGAVVELFDGGWLPLEEGLPRVRVIVARHLAPTPDKPVTVGKRIDEWVYELFMTTLDVDRFLVEDVLDLYHGRGAFEGVLADEDSEGDPDRWCSRTECGQELWQIICHWVWNLRLSLGQTLQPGTQRELEWAPPKEATLVFVVSDPPPEEYGPWQKAAEKGRARGRFGAAAFAVQENGTLRCPAGASLWLSEVRQETPFTQRAVYLAYQTDCQPCSYREQCLGPEAKGHRARRVSAVRHLLSGPSGATRTPVVVGSMRWIDVAGRALRRTWTTHWRRQYVEVLPLEEGTRRVAPPPRAPRSVRSHHRWNWQDRLARNAWWGPPHLRVTVAGVPVALTSSAR